MELGINPLIMRRYGVHPTWASRPLRVDNNLLCLLKQPDKQELASPIFVLRLLARLVGSLRGERELRSLPCLLSEVILVRDLPQRLLSLADVRCISQYLSVLWRHLHHWHLSTFDRNELGESPANR